MFAASLIGYISGEVAGRGVDHDDDDDKKGQWNRSIASLRSELYYQLSLLTKAVPACIILDYRRLGLSSACASWDNSKNICAT